MTMLEAIDGVIEFNGHRISNQDVMKIDINELCPYGVDVMYSDPPWGDSTIKMFNTMNIKQNEHVTDRNDVSAQEFVERMFEIADQLNPKIFLMEYGVKWRGLIESIAQRHGFNILGRGEPIYSGKNYPLDLFVMSKHDITLPDGYFEGIKDTKAMKTLQAAINPLKGIIGNTILDPCCGMGYTAQIAIDNGLTFYGNELNRYRLEGTLKRFRKANLL